VSSGAAKVFREFKWGLLTLFLLMVVVVGLVYDGGRKKKGPTADLPKGDDRASEIALDSGPETGAPPVNVTPTPPGGPVTQAPPAPGPVTQQPKNGPPVFVDTQPPVVPPGGTPPKAITELAPKPDKPIMHPVPPMPDHVAPTGGEKSYTVVAGDTLTSIANSQLPGKGNIKAILDANKDALSNPNRLRLGMTLKIPAAISAAPDAAIAKKDGAKETPKKELAKETAKETAITSDKPGQPKADAGTEYMVQTGDTLERIARKLFNDGRKWRDLYEWNRDQLPEPGRLRVGQTLKVKHGSTNTAGTLPAGTPRASADEAAPAPEHPAPSTATASASDNSKHAAEIEVMSSTSGASLP
jgi:nucleoid-associated protein YgaU